MPKLSFFIGIGGTGDWVLTYLKAKLMATEGKVPDEIRMRLFDTVSAADREKAFDNPGRTYRRSVIGSGIVEEKVAEVGGERLIGKEYMPLVMPGTKSFYDLAEEIGEGRNEYLQWFRAKYYLGVVPRAQFNLTDGAGQWRQFGRMALFQYSSGLNSEVLNVLSTTLGELKAMAKKQKIVIFIISSLAGGTGAGAFLDLANLVRYCIDRPGGVDVQYQLIGIVVLPGAFSRVTEINLSRAYAAFRELHRFQSSFGTADPFPITYGQNLPTDIKVKLFDTVYLLDAGRERNPLDGVRPEEGLFPSIADGLELFLDQASGQELFTRSCNITAQHAETVKSGTSVPAIYSSFGTWKIIFPARLYAMKFTGQVVREYLQQLAQPVLSMDGLTVQRLRDNLRRGQETVIDHRTEAIDILLNTHSFFSNFVDRLPGRPLEGNLEDIARLVPQRIVGKYLQVEDSQASRLVATEGAKLHMEVVKVVQDGSQTGDSSGTAITNITNRCKSLREHYFEVDFAETIKKVRNSVVEEINARLDLRLREVLRGGEDYRAKLGTLGLAGSLLGHMSTVLKNIQDNVFNAIYEKIDEEFGTLVAAQEDVNNKSTEMGLTKGYDGHALSQKPKSKSHAAQKAYLKAMGRYIEREQQDQLLQTLHGIIGDAANRVDQWFEEVNSWADYLCKDSSILLPGAEGDQVKVVPSAYNRSTKEVQRCDADLLRIGKSYTSSIGMSVWDRERNAQPDTSMGGWEKDLFEEMKKGGGTIPLWEQWLKTTEWDVNYESEPGRRPVFGLSINVPSVSAGEEQLSLPRESVFDLLYRQAFGRIFGRIEDISILDYLARQNKADIARHLFDKTAPMLSTTAHDVHQKAYLIYQAKDEHVKFMSEVAKELEGQPGLGENVEVFDRYENRHTLTFAIMQDRVEENGIVQVTTYGKNYWQEMQDFDLEALQHRQYHIFRCEEEAVGIEKAYYGELGNYTGPYLAPLVYRQLEYPYRVQSFIDALVYGMVGSGMYIRGNFRAWCLSYQSPVTFPEPQSKSTSAKKKGGGKQKVPAAPAAAPGFNINDIIENKTPGVVLAWTKANASGTLLDAMSGYVLRGNCLQRPAWDINWDGIEKALGDKRVEIHAQFGDDYQKKILELYEDFLQQIDQDDWWKKRQQAGSDWERDSLKILFTHYLAEKIRELKMEF